MSKFLWIYAAQRSDWKREIEDQTKNRMDYLLINQIYSVKIINVSPNK
jgi:hypothetical protein